MFSLTLNAAAYHDCSAIWAYKGQYPRALASQPNLSEAFFYGSLAYEKMGNLKKALADVKHLVKLQPKGVYGPMKILKLRDRLGKNSQAGFNYAA